jgi:L-ascorbate metabolism protein UlaG (beta-lactamase superfamily)
MSIALTWLGHATWIVSSPGGRLLVDPFLDDNPSATLKADAVTCDAILLTHGHFDHVADAVAIAKRLRVPVVSNWEIAQWLAGHGVEDCRAMNIGGRVAVPGGSARMEMAFHSSTLPDGTSGGTAAGYVLHLDGRRIYIAGDTSLFSDMERIGRSGLDAAVVPIGDVFTMGPEDAAEAIRLLAPRVALPSHYGTWPPIAQDAAAWAAAINHLGRSEAHVLQPGDSMAL